MLWFAKLKIRKKIMYIEFTIETLTQKHSQSCRSISNAELYKSISVSIAGCILLQSPSAPPPERVSLIKLTSNKFTQTWRAHFNDHFTVASVYDSLNFGLPMNSTVIKIKKIGLSDLIGILESKKIPRSTKTAPKNSVRLVNQRQPQRMVNNNLGEFLQCHSVRLFTPSHYNQAPVTQQRRNPELNPYTSSRY
jgi:hypothetical protein